MTRDEVAEKSRETPDHFLVWCGGAHTDRFATRHEAFSFLRDYLVRGKDAYGHPVNYDNASIWKDGESLDLSPMMTTNEGV